MNKRGQTYLFWMDLYLLWIFIGLLIILIIWFLVRKRLGKIEEIIMLLFGLYLLFKLLRKVFGGL